MLYRFREAQAAEMGLAIRDKRPRFVSSVRDLRQCERWRGEVLREISRKMSKIMDPGLTDFEIRDLNDEINRLLREKNSWENQIIQLGGANYKRAGRILDKEGNEVLGSRGYKYFGRAKELPGVKEMFETAKDTNADVEQARQTRYDKFNDPPQGYYGDDDDKDDDLLEYERRQEEEGWQDAIDHLTELGIDLSDPPPAVPERHFVPYDLAASSAVAADKEEPAEEPASKGKGKRKAAASSKAKKASKKSTKETPSSADGFYTILREDELRPPTLMTLQEVEKYIVQRQKQALLKQLDEGA